MDISNASGAELDAIGRFLDLDRGLDGHIQSDAAYRDCLLDIWANEVAATAPLAEEEFPATWSGIKARQDKSATLQLAAIVYAPAVDRCPNCREPKTQCTCGIQ